MDRFAQLNMMVAALCCGAVAGAVPAQAETLSDALIKAYKNNPTLTGARADQRAVDEDVNIQRADGRPDASANATYQENLYRDLQSPNLPFITTPKRSVSANAQLNVPIYSGGIVRNGIRAAKLRVESGRGTLRATEASVFTDVVAAYLDVIRDSAILALNEQNVSALELNRQATTERFQVGDLTKTDVAQSESRLALAMADLQTAQAQLIASKEQYIAVVGTPPDQLELPPELPGLPGTVDDALMVALSENPQILAANKARDAARYDVRSAEGQVAPRLSGFLRGDYTNFLKSERDLTLTQFAPYPENGAASAGATVTIPFYQGGRPGAVARQASAREASAIERATQVERDVIARTRSAYAGWRAASQAIISTRKAVDASTLALEGVKAENSAGTRTIIEILNAEQEALSARVQLVTAQRDAYVASFSLLASMGHAEATDLGLQVGTPYDPRTNYNRVRSKIFDFQFARDPKPEAGRTADTPAQTSDKSGVQDLPISPLPTNPAPAPRRKR